jgi:phasin
MLKQTAIVSGRSNLMQRTPFDIPDQMRDMADRSVDQARKAFEQFMEATQQAVAKTEGSARSIREGAADVNRQAIAYLEENIAKSFDFAQQLARARTVEEMIALQREFVERQMAAAAEQGKGLGEMFGRTAGATDAAASSGPAKKGK